MIRANNTVPRRLGPQGHGGKMLFKVREGEDGSKAANEYCAREAQLKFTGSGRDKPGSEELGSGRRPGDGTRPGTREAEVFFRRKGTQLPPPPLASQHTEWMRGTRAPSSTHRQHHSGKKKSA